jgi:hypothetical protein
MSGDLRKFFEAEKELAISPDWVEQNSEVFTIVCPLQIDGVVIEGLQFRATARKTLPEELVTVQLEYYPALEPGGPFSRLEWKPLSGHNNKGRGPKEWRHRQIIGCHHHEFELNMKYAEKDLRRGVLPIALPLADSPSNFDGLLVRIKKEFRIVNVEWIEAPPWEPVLV